MAIDADLVLYSNTNLNFTNNAYSPNGTDLNIGKSGLHRNAQIVTLVQTPNVDRELTFKYYVSRNNDTFRQVGQITYPVGYAGKQVLQLSTDDAWQEYVASEIMVRCNVSAANHANNSDFDRVLSYIGYGEAATFGRKAGAADALVDA